MLLFPSRKQPPHQLLQAVKDGLHPYAYRRLAAFGATQVPLTKQMEQIAALDAKIGALFVERAVLQQSCQLECQSLSNLFMTEQELAEISLGMRENNKYCKD